MANLDTKPSSSDDGLVDRLSISTKMLHEPDLYATIYGTIVCPITRVPTPKVLPTGYPTTHDIDYAISLQYTQRQGHDSMNISNLTDPGLKPGAIWFV